LFTMPTIGATKAQIAKIANTLKKAPEEAERQTATAPDRNRASSDESTRNERGLNIGEKARSPYFQAIQFRGVEQRGRRATTTWSSWRKTKPTVDMTSNSRRAPWRQKTISSTDTKA
uniref:PABC domain-containing protein n=1 Tax=Heligmosomoides polygyrus TaxID=6339 RepID=A0A183GFF2_HELPZ